MSTLGLADGTLYYELTGRGAPVLFIQGVGVCGSGWTPQVTALSGEFQCLSFDNRGIGKSCSSSRRRARLSIEQMASDACALMDNAGWESAHVVGHSMGGLIAQQLALNSPQRVKSLSLLCTFSKGPEAARLTPWVLWMSLRTRIGSRAMRRRAFLEMLFPAEYLERTSTTELASKLAPVIGRDLADQPAVMMQQVGAMRLHNCSGRLNELSRIPTLVVSGESDPIARPEYGRRLSHLIPGAQYVEIIGASHGVTIQEPERVNGLLRSHFVGGSCFTAAARQ